MQWRLIGTTLRLGFLLRIPVLTLIVLGALGPLALHNSLLSNLFDQGNPNRALQDWYLFTVSFAAFMLAFTAVTNINITLCYGTDRFEDGPSLGLAQKRPLLTFLLGCAAAFILVVSVYFATQPMQLVNAVFLLLGFLGAFGAVLLAKVVQLALTDPKTTPHPPPYLVFPVYKITSAERFFDNIYCWSSGTSRLTKNLFNRISQWPLGILQPAGQGYLIDVNPPKGEPLRLRSGQVFGVSLFVIAFLSYLLIGYRKSEITAADNKVPALAFVLLVLIVACWGLSGLTFFFDRYRFPLLWTLAVFSLITLWSPQSDHFFRVVPRLAAMREPPSAAAYIKKRLEMKEQGKLPKRLIVVATPGGGIQAAAWTAEVLTEMDNRAPGFRDSVAVISSVSGGSLGSMIYAASFAGRVKPEAVPQNARQSAIDEVAWGWTVPDLWRVMLPWFRINRSIDRGWALEKKWAAINNLSDTRDSQGSLLGDWADIARDGLMPALLINSMLVERGQPVVFSNTRFPVVKDDQARIANFYDLYPNQYLRYDIRVNTAARLSASFSYVAPASRPDLDGIYARGFHFVDGGYYDNYGMTSLLAWLGEALEDPSVREQWSDILILQIRHFNAGRLPGGSRQGWGFQLLAPPFALYNMRDYAQESVARKQLELFAKYYSSQRVNIWKTTIKYAATNTASDHCEDQPLSWKLDQEQQACIVTTWADVAGDPKQKQAGNQEAALQCVASYLRGEPPQTRCKSAADGKD
jgi:hypothetical protein